MHACTIRQCTTRYWLDDHTSLLPSYVSNLTAMPPKKKRGNNLAELASHTYVSERGLVDVLRSVKDDPSILDTCSRSSVKRSRDEYVDIRTPFGPLLRQMTIPEDDDTIGLEFTYVHPIAMLSHAVQHCKAYGDLFISCHEANPSRMNKKWSICLYSDEVTIGDPLSKNVASRKVQAIYWGVKELGMEALACDSSWFILTCIRGDVVKHFGGLSELTSALVDTFYSTGCDVRGGIKLNAELIVFMDIQIIVQDYDAFKYMFESKGASGLIMCAVCQNCVDHKKRHLHVAGKLVSSAEIDDLSKFNVHTPDTIADA